MPTEIMMRAQRSPQRNGTNDQRHGQDEQGKPTAGPRGQNCKHCSSTTHAEIASRTSTHREAVTRELNRLAKLGIIEQRNRMLFVKDVSRLRALVHPIGE